ncbi:MAG: outer membrane beta-barrel protein [Chlamydiae bacterium]|nr:outer membrane beta-barrel protein [Chlamydiota bacterium]MBI3276184.1 outer membrane beta-barrel protein [Chlamydiota bacterium]
MKKWKIYLFLLGMSFLLGSMGVQAEVSFAKAPGKDKMKETLHWFHPRLDFSTQYDDNIFLEPANEQDGFIFTTSPGLSIFVPFDGDRHLFSLDYQVDFLNFSEFGSQDFVAQSVRGTLDFNFPKFYVINSDMFRRTSLRSDTEFTERVDRNENTYNFAIGTKDWNRFSFETGYNLFFTFYDDDSLDSIDRYEHVVRATGYYRLFTKTKALLEYSHGFLIYPDDTNNRDGDYDQISAGLTGELFTRMVGTAKAGYQNRDYDNGQDLSNLVVDLSVTEYFSPETSLTVAYTRTAIESVFVTNDFYFTDYVSATLDQKLFWNLNGVLGFSYQTNDYDETVTVDSVTGARNDDLYGVKAGVTYPFREWLTTGVEYNYYDRSSNFDDFDYNDNRVMWKVSAKY